MRWVAIAAILLLIWWVAKHWRRVRAAAGALGSRPLNGVAVRSYAAKTTFTAAPTSKSPALLDGARGASAVPSTSIRSGCSQ